MTGGEYQPVVVRVSVEGGGEDLSRPMTRHLAEWYLANVALGVKWSLEHHDFTPIGTALPAWVIQRARIVPAAEAA